MQGFRVLLVASEATSALDAALANRGLRVEQRAEKDAVFESGTDSPDCVVVVGEFDTGFLSRVKTHVGSVPVFFVTDGDGSAADNEGVTNGASVIDHPQTESERAALAARIERATQFADWSSPGEPDSLYRTVVEQSFDAIFIAQDGGFQFWNRKLTELTGLDDAELSETPLLDVIHPDDRERVASISERRRSGSDAPERYDVRIVTADGETRQCQVNVKDIEYHDNYGVLVSMHDVTEQRETEARFRAFVENSRDIVSFIDTDGNIRYHSPAVESVLGYTPDEQIGRSVFDFVHPEDRSEIERAYRDAVGEESNAGKSYRYRYRHADGSWVWLESIGSRQHSSLLDGFVVSSRDVTEQQRRESQLEQYETIIESIQLGAYVVDSDCVIQYVNEAAMSKIGVPRGRFVGEHVSAAVESGIVTEAQFERIESVLDSVLAGETDGVRFEVPISSSGRSRVVDFGITPVVEDDGSITGAVGIATDITDQKLYEQRLNALHSASRDLSAETTREGVAEIVSEVTADALEYEVNRVFLYDEATDALVPTAATEAATAISEAVTPVTRNPGRLWAVFESGEDRLLPDVTSGTWSEETPMGETHAELLVSIPSHGVLVICEDDEAMLRDHRRPLAKVLASNTKAALDRVEREQLLRRREAELARQNEQLDSFASAVSHDLQNPLNVAMGYLELAKETCDAPELDRIGEAHERMSAIVQDVLALAQNGQRVEEVEPVSLTQAALEAWNIVSPGTPDASLEIDTSLTIDAHPGRLRQLLENLLSNAIRYGGDDVTVSIGPLDDRNGFYVEDDGPGIDDDERPRIFEAGYTTGSEGTGFGLNIVQSIVSAHGWSIWFTDGVEGGARFEITTEADR
ncbi:PAS domain-containing sensor histidine kinase [Haloferax namakaokahaiae]|uniref:histidine kinase n=1 Tax=Haloferax namakaokahaiae TaxID=1748331 RepID=A0ABD5ZCI9_9EURY